MSITYFLHKNWEDICSIQWIFILNTGNFNKKGTFYPQLASKVIFTDNNAPSIQLTCLGFEL